MIEDAYLRATDVLHRCVTPMGFKASALEGGYPQVWARDACITALGALATGDAELTACAKASLHTLGEHQSELGMIHLNVDTRTGEVTTENAGAVDANPWYILGHFAHHVATADRAFLAEHWPRLERALLWLRYQDMNACGLLEVPEAADWADLYSVRYNVLYDNLLYLGALRAMASMAVALGRPAEPYLALAEDVGTKVNMLMWLDRPWDGRAFGEQLEALKDMRLEWYLLYQNTATLTELPYYLPWVGFREFGTAFDGFGNMLAILLRVADQHKADSILGYVHASGTNRPYSLKAFYPPIYPGDRDWREYFRSRNLNLPHQYHNGGIWPFLGGFYVAALVESDRHEAARRELRRLARANKAGRERRWEFNEWLHGTSGRPMGHPLQAWSAAMFIYASQAVWTGSLPLLSGLAPP